MSVSAMTQDEAVLEVANIIGRDKTSLSADQSTTYETRIKTWLYWSHLTIARLYAFPELDQDPISYSLGTSTNVYTLTTLAISSSRLRQILGVTIIDGTASIKIPQVLPRTFQKDFPYPLGLATQKPSCYTLYGKRVEFDRISNSAYSVQFRTNYYPENYTSGSTASVYLNKDDLIIAGAVTHAYISLQETDDAKTWSDIFSRRFQQIVGPEIDPGDWEPEGRGFDYSSQRSTLDSYKDPFQLANS